MENRLSFAQNTGNMEMIRTAECNWEAVKAMVDETSAHFAHEDVASYDLSVTSEASAWVSAGSLHNNDEIVKSISIKARSVIESTYHAMQKSLNAVADNEKTLHVSLTPTQRHQEKEIRNEQARELLQCMSKGNQKLDMFQNQEALRGYTRQKFIERAMLVTNVLSKLLPATTEPYYVNHSCRILWERIQKVNGIVSIGCGPGCDALGVAAWLDAAVPSSLASERSAVMLDWAMSDWQYTILNALHPLLVPSCYRQINYATCDVRLPWSDAAHKEVRQSVTGENLLLVTSYLLSETRTQWQVFYQELWDVSAPGTLFLFTDPTAWQMRQWLRSKDKCCFNWLDSSMHYPALQELEKRVGPAALLAMKPLGNTECTNI